MPLEAVSPNIDHRCHNAQRKSKSGVEMLSSTSKHLSTVQNMLKTNTEIGDEGQFANRPSRLPRARSHLHSVKSHPDSFDFPVHSDPCLPGTAQHGLRPRYRAPQYTPSVPNLSTNGLLRPILRNTHDNRQEKAPGSKLYTQTSRDNANPNLERHPLGGHRSLMVLRSRGSHPSTLGKNWYGNRSFNELHGRYSTFQPSASIPRPSHNNIVNASTPSPSPTSSVYFRRMPLHYHRQISRSRQIHSVRYSPTVSRRSSMLVQGHVPSKSPTMMRSSLQNTPSTSHTATLLQTPLTTPGSNNPPYYDYTECFSEHSSPASNLFSSGTNAPTGSTPIDKTLKGMVKQAQTPFGIRTGSKFYPAELPTIHNRRPSEQSKQSDRKMDLNYMSGSGEVVVPDSRVEEVTVGIEQKDKETSADDRHARRISMGSRRTCHSSTSSIFFPNLCRGSRDLVSIVARMHHGQGGKNLEQSDSSATKSDEKAQDSGMSYGVERCTNKREPSFESPQIAEPDGHISTTRQRSNTTDGSIHAKNKVHSLPSRPMSSYSHRRLEVQSKHENFSMLDDIFVEKRASKHTSIGNGNSKTFSFLRQLENPNGSAIAQDLSMKASSKDSLGSATELAEKDLLGEGVSDGSIRMKRTAAPPEEWNRSLQQSKGRPKTSQSLQDSSVVSSNHFIASHRRLFTSMDATTSSAGLRSLKFTASSSRSSVARDTGLRYGSQTFMSSSQQYSDTPTKKPRPLPDKSITNQSYQTRRKVKMNKSSNNPKVSRRLRISSQITRSHSDLRSGSEQSTKESTVSKKSKSEARPHLRVRLKLNSQQRTKPIRVHLARDIENKIATPSGSSDPFRTQRPSNTDKNQNPSETSFIANTASGKFMSSNDKRDSAGSTTSSIETSFECTSEASSNVVVSDQSEADPVKPLTSRYSNLQPPILNSTPKLALPAVSPISTTFDLQKFPKYDTAKSVGQEKLEKICNTISSPTPKPCLRCSLRKISIPQRSKDKISRKPTTTPNAGHRSRGSKCGLKFIHASPSQKFESKTMRGLPLEHTVAMSDIAYKKRKAMEKFNDWWNEQCLLLKHTQNNKAS